MSTALTTGMTMPMDLRASVVQSAQSWRTVDQMEESPKTARQAANTAACRREESAESESAKLREGILVRFSSAGDEIDTSMTYLRRALMRARAEAKNAPAEPTTARMAVGFSGEVTHPVCA